MLLWVCLSWAVTGAAEVAEPLRFHVPFEGTAAPVVARGAATVGGAEEVAFVAGRRGQGVRVERTPLVYSVRENLDKHRGTICLWIQPLWNGDDGKNHGFLADDLPFNQLGANNLYLWKWSTGVLRFDVRDASDHYLTTAATSWRAGEWHHVAAAWDCAVGTWLFVDGELRAARRFTWEPRTSNSFRLGSNWNGQHPAQGVFDDLRIYECPLTAEQVQVVMRGEPLETVVYEGLMAPRQVRVGETCEVRLQVQTIRDLARAYPVRIALNDLVLGSFTVPRLTAGRATLGPFALTVPPYYYLPPGQHTLWAELAGTLPAGDRRAEAVVELLTPLPQPARWEVSPEGTLLRNGRPWLAEGEALFFERKLYEGEAARQKAKELLRRGRLGDALRVRVLDRVDCTQTDHHYWENSPARVVELGPGKKFRLVGVKEAVTKTRRVYGQERKVLPAFSYRLRCAPRPTPHLLLVEIPNDRERNLELSLDAAPGSTPAPHLRESGLGRRELINLGVVYTGRQYPCDGQVYTEYFLFFPKTEAVEVTVARSDREAEAGPDAGSAVSQMVVVEVLDSLRELANAPLLPPPGPQRTVSLFYPQVTLLFDEYGFTGTSPAQREAGARVLMDYLRFLGFNRLEFHPYAFSPRAYFPSKIFTPAGDWDVFAYLLPAAAEAGLEILPRVDSLVFYDELLKEDPDNFQQGVGGSIRQYFGQVPDPLRPAVQQLLFDLLQEMLERTRGWPNVPGVGFRANAKFGVLYVGSHWNAPPQETGYSAWDLRAFEQATGIKMGEGKEEPAREAREWLREHAWEAWIGWRCRGIHDWWVRARDLVREAEGKLLFVRTIIPYDHHFPSDQTQWYGRGLDPLTIHRYHGYDPALYREETGMLISRAISLGADRYNRGRVHNWLWWHQPQLAQMYRTREGTAVEFYYIYWELPDHPKGFRVGPSWPRGRAALHPLLYALRTMNPRDLTFYNWHRATTGREWELREFCRAFRALPLVPPRDFEGALSVEPPEVPVWVKWFADRLALVNDHPLPVTVRLSGLKPPAQRGEKWVDLATNETVAVGEPAPRGEVTLTLRPYDLRVLIFSE